MGEIMSKVREEAISVIESLPDVCTLEDNQYHLYVRAKLERGIKAADEGRCVSPDEAENRVRVAAVPCNW